MKHETKTTETHETTRTKTNTKVPTAQQFQDELDRLVELPESEKQYDRYINTLLLFYVTHPDEATPFLKAVLPRVKSLSNADVRLLGQMSATAFPATSFPYLTFAKNNRVPAQTVRNWFSGTVFPAAALAWMKGKFQNLVYAGTWKLLKGQEDLCKGTDLSEEVENCSQMVWAWAARPENISSLMKDREKRPSRIGSRLKAYAARNVARTWLTLAIRSKKKEPVIVAVDDLDQKVKASPIIGGGTPLEQQKPRTTALFCITCRGLQSVLSEAEDARQLACGHSRSAISPGIGPSTK